MIPKIVHQTAASSHLTWEERMLVRRTMKILHGWDYRFWTDADLSRHIEQGWPQYFAEFSTIGRGVIRSDIGRYAVLYTFGGLYLDTDYKLLNRIDRFLSADLLLPIERVPAKGSGFKLGNAILASKPQHEFWCDLIDDIFLNSHADFATGNPVALTGPWAVTNLWTRNQQQWGSIAMPLPIVFYPEMTAMNTSFRMNDDTVGGHLCWGSWRGKAGITRVRNFIRRKVTAVTA
jgi:mannosyltransferase OCH1-like enzyme